LVVQATGASAQDLFELEVFRYETTPRGDYDVELHSNAMTRGSVLPLSAKANHRPVHLSVEVARGWTDRFETALFVQTAPFASSGGARLAGGHLRSKVRLGALPRVPLHAALSAEYTFNLPPSIMSCKRSRFALFSTTCEDVFPSLRTPALKW
jgi:hypothetical protein